MKKSLPRALQTLLPALTLVCCNAMPWISSAQFRVTFPGNAPKELPDYLEIGNVSTNGWSGYVGINGLHLPLWLPSALILFAMLHWLARPEGPRSRRVQVALHAAALAIILAFIVTAGISPQIDVGIGAQFALFVTMVSMIAVLLPNLGALASSEDPALSPQ